RGRGRLRVAPRLLQPRGAGLRGAGVLPGAVRAGGPGRGRPGAAWRGPGPAAGDGVLRPAVVVLQHPAAVTWPESIDPGPPAQAAPAPHPRAAGRRTQSVPRA